MVRFGFQIRTRSGQRVDNISIMAGSQPDAERRLRQMYPQCNVLECRSQAVPRRVDSLDLEGVIGMISASTTPKAAAPAAPSADDSGTH